MDFETKLKDNLHEKPESEENFNFLSSFAQDAIIQINDRGLIEYWNKSAEKLFGLNKADALNKSFHLLFAPERYFEAFNKAFVKFRNSGEGTAINKTLELEGKRKDGEEFPIELSLSSFQVNGKWNAVGIIRDITKRKKLEQNLRNSEENLRVLFDNINDAIYVLDLNGNFMDVNATACKRLGYEKSELLQMHIRDINAPEKIAENPQLIDEKLWLGKNLVETVHVAKSGKRISVEIYGKQSLYQNKPVIIAVSRDITKRKITEKQLIESEKKYKNLSNELELILDNIPALIFYKDTNNNFIRVNKYIADAYKMTKEALNGKSIFELYPKEVAQAYLDDDLEVITSGKPKLSYEEQWETSDGLRWTLTSKIPLIDENGEATGIIGTSIDITERKSIEEKLRESEIKFRNMINNLDVAFYQVVLGGNLLNHNPAYNMILGYDKSENLKNSNVKDLWENPKLREDYLQQLLTDDFVKNYICHALKKDGTKIVLQLNSHVIKDKEGKPARIDGTFIDITDKFVLEQKLIESEETYHSLFNNSLSGIAFHKIIYTPNKEPINYIITDVNPMFEKILHLKKEDVLNKLVTETYGVEEPPYFETYLKVAETMKSESFNSYFKPMDKYFKISAFSFEKGKFVTVFEDITEEKLLETELKNAHSELDEIFNLAVPICVIDNNYNITQANKSLISLFNLKKSEIIGRKCFDVWKEPYCNTPKCSIRQHIQGKNIIEYETEIETGEDSKLSLLVRSTAHRNPNRETITIFKSIMDITQRKTAEEKLKKTLETTRKVLETLPMGIILVGNDGTIQSVNRAALNLLDYNNEFEILGKNWNEITYPAKNNAYPIIDHWKKKNQTELILKNKTGNKFPVLRSALPITLGDSNYLMEAFVDITSLKEIQNQLKESQEKYLDLIETSTLGILEIDLIENKIDYVNPALLDIIERSMTDIKTENLFYKIIHPDDLSLLMSSREEREIEVRILLRNGAIKWVAATRIYTYGINQQPINLRLWIIDITERKKNERLKEKFTEQLEKEVDYRTKDLKELLEKQRLYLDQIEKSSRFKTEFLSTMSHELRTPLNAIIGFTDLLIEGVFGELNKEQSEYIKDIDDSSNHLLDMITDILDISKIESGQATLKIEEIQLNNIIAQVISILKPLYLEKDIKWELVGLKKEQFIFADRIKFKQIIYNLLSNAIKFTKKGKITFEFKENKYDWEFAIKDTGIGISENDFDIIFKDFKRVKSEYVEATQGTGLGLALTKRLVNIQGGDISFSSKLEKGTAFTFNLPKTIKEKLANVKKIESFLNKL